MKNKINIFGIFALTGILLFAACSDLMNPPEISKGGETGTLLVQVGTGEARTLTPSSADLGELSYNLVIKYSSEIIYEGEIKSEGYTLQAGRSYALTVDAFNADKELVASHTEPSVFIEVGKTATKKMVLRPVYNVDIPGKFSYSVTLPPAEEVPYTSATLTLTPQETNSGTVTINLLDSPASPEDKPLELPPGRYELVINVASPRQINGQALNIYRREMVYIYSRLTTSTVAGEYAFTAEDFEADVRFSGTAQVIKVGDGSLDGNYIPKKVYIQLDEDFDGDAAAGEAAITEKDGVYYWELALPSHFVLATGNLNQATFKFEATHKTTATKTIATGWITESGINPQGKTGISLTARTTSIAPAAAVDSAAVISFSNTDVVQGGPVTISIKPPNKYGLIANSVTINGSSSYISDIVSTATGITATATIPSNAVNPRFNAQFFHLEGYAYVSGANTDNYSPKKVEAYELDADGRPLPIIGSGTVSTATNTWEIVVPQNYVSRSTDNLIHFRVYLEATGKPAYTWDNYTTNVYWVSSSGSSVSISAPLFEVTNVTASVQGNNSVEISWDDASAWAAGGIRIYRSENGNSYSLITSTALAKTRTTYTDPYAYGNRYSYVVKGIKTAGGSDEGPDSSIAYAKQQQPSNLTATAQTNSHGLLTSVNLNWSHNGGAAEFLIERVGGSSWSWSTVGTIWGGATSYSDTTVDMVDSQYQYRITARTVSGSSYTDYDSDPKATDSYVGPSVSASSISSGTTYNYYIGYGEKAIYRVPNYGYNYASLYLYDMYNTYYGSESVDAYFTVYNNRTKSDSYYDATNGGSFYLYSNGGYYSDLILVVEAANGWSSGYYSFRISY